MADSSDSYDVEYSIEENFNRIFHHSKTHKIPGLSRTLKIARSFSLTTKNLKLLRKNGHLSRWDYFRMLFNKKLESFPFFSGITSILLSTAAVFFIAYLLIGLIEGAISALLFFPVLFSVGLVGFGMLKYFNEYANSILQRKLPQQFKRKTHQIIASFDNQSLYGLIENIKEYELTHSERRELFNIAEKYPDEANEQIDKLMKLKESIPVENTENDSALNIFSDTDKMLDELFDIRDSYDSKKLLEATESLLKSAVERKKIEKLGVSVEELSEVSEYLEKMKEENQSTQDKAHSEEVSQTLAEMNKALDVFENVEEQRSYSSMSKR